MEMLVEHLSECHGVLLAVTAIGGAGAELDHANAQADGKADARA